MKRRILIATLVVATLPVGYASLFSRSKYESAPYKVEVSDGKFELRKYPELVVATTEMSKDSGSNSAFKRLFGYISGKNETGKKIAMTTPVFRAPDRKGMSFVVPADVAKKGAPKANDSSVKVVKRRAGTFATYRFSGRWSEANDKKAKERLTAWMEKNGLKPIGKFETANYDPPFTPPIMRRNEVLVRVSPKSK